MNSNKLAVGLEKHSNTISLVDLNFSGDVVALEGDSDSYSNLSLPRKTTSTISRNGMNKEAKDGNEYIPRWARSSRPPIEREENPGEMDSSKLEDENFSADELISFSDEESKALHQEIKLLEQRRDEASAAVQTNRERVDVIIDHLHIVRQEIDHTNSLLTAKKSEMETEEHFLSLANRELGQYERDASGLDNDAVIKEKNIKSTTNRIQALTGELDKLRSDFNWNQEELEQWASVAAKKEEENFALQKYALADEVKIKELTLTIDDLTKKSVEKKSMLENEITETKSNQTELEKLAERFKIRHDERRGLIKQWKDTIESMNKRDRAITGLAEQYSDCMKDNYSRKSNLALNNERYEVLQNGRDDYERQINDMERILQTKRHELLSLYSSESLLKEEVDSMRRETAASVASIENKRYERKLATQGLEQKQLKVTELAFRLQDVKNILVEENIDSSTKEQLADAMEKSVTEREKLLQQAEKNISNLKKKKYKDSQRLANLRKEESDLMVDIRGAQSNIKNFTSKMNELESKRMRQQEILYNASFQLQQMEKKVSRGLGERSKEEQKKLQSRISVLEEELQLEMQKKSLLVQQERKLQSELRRWNKKREACQLKYNETKRKIDDSNLEISACEMSLKDIIGRKEEVMVSHDVTLLDVRRRRDSLRNLLEAVWSLKQKKVESSLLMQDRKEEILSHKEVKTAQLRSCNEERHIAAKDLGKMKVYLNKIKSKCGMISSVNAGKGESDEYESPEYKLIMAAQKREELQQEGDLLDETIQEKETEVRSMRKTLMELRQRNTSFRASFSKADMNGAKAQELSSLGVLVQTEQDNLVKAKKDLQELELSVTKDTIQLEYLKRDIDCNENLKRKQSVQKSDIERNLEICKNTLDQYNENVQNCRDSINQVKSDLQHKKFITDLVRIQADRLCKLLFYLGDEFPVLRNDIRADMKKMGIRNPSIQEEKVTK